MTRNISKMRAFKYVIIYVLVLLTKPHSILAQQYPTINNLRGTPQINGTALIEFTVGQSSNILIGCDLQRSSDSAFNFVSVYYFPGSMGGSISQDFSYYDYPPDPTKKYYYKIIFSNGSQSNTIVVNMGDVFGNYKIAQHPIIDDGSSKLDFAYIPGTIWVMDIADAKGYRLYQFTGINQSNFIINASWFNWSGIYFFRLYPADGSTVIRGRFVVMKSIGD